MTPTPGDALRMGGAVTAARGGFPYQPRRKAAYPVGDKMDQLADALADHDLDTGDPGGNLTKAAAVIGMKRDYAQTLFQRMRRRLGEQAR